MAGFSSPNARRYKGNDIDTDGNGLPDTAEDANNLGGVGPGSYYRLDQNETVKGILGSEAQGLFDASLGQSNGEVSRIGGSASDLVLDIQGGHGRVAWMWNAYYDGTDFRYIVGNEPAMMLKMHNGAAELWRAPSGSADGVISFDQFVIDGNGPSWNGNTIWHQGNDGSGSGLDADAVDGKDASDLGGNLATDADAPTVVSNSNSISGETWTVWSTTSAATVTNAIAAFDNGSNASVDAEVVVDGTVIYSETIDSVVGTLMEIDSSSGTVQLHAIPLPSFTCDSSAEVRLVETNGATTSVAAQLTHH